MRIAIVDPSAYTPPYDEALGSALVRRGHAVTLYTSAFAYGEVTRSGGHQVAEHFYRSARGAAGSRLRLVSKLAAHLPDMVRLRTAVAGADVVHFQWVTIPALDRHLLPRRPLVLTAHDLLPREPRPGQVRAQSRLLGRADAVITHSRYGRDRLLDLVGLPESKLHVVPHGAFAHLAAIPPVPLPPELADDGRPIVLFLGLLRPYKGVSELLEAWRGVDGARLWVVGHPRMPIRPLVERAEPSVSMLPRFVADEELAACFRRADLVVLPYLRTERFDQSGVMAAALAFGRPVLASDVGGFPELTETGAVAVVPAGDVGALGDGLRRLIADEPARRRMAAAAAAAAAGPLSWDAVAARTEAVYAGLTG